MFEVPRLLPVLKPTWKSKRRGDPCPVRTCRHRPSLQPRLECLEERHVPSGYTVINMGSLGGTKGLIGGINDRGGVVGVSSLAGETGPHAFLFKQGKMT